MLRYLESHLSDESLFLAQCCLES
eukprot:COSAG02_NODE_55760_length_288_cov_3.735450_1_plen_23_part_10